MADHIPQSWFKLGTVAKSLTRPAICHLSPGERFDNRPCRVTAMGCAASSVVQTARFYDAWPPKNKEEKVAGESWLVPLTSQNVERTLREAVLVFAPTVP